MVPRPEVRHYVRNQSSRNGTKPRLIVLHDTEGANLPGIRDLEGLAGWFDNPNAQASSHAANDAEGNDARYVPDSRKAWHCAGYNSVSLGLEQIGFASQKSWPDAQIRNTAEWIAYWSNLHDIPLQRGYVAEGRVVKPGVVTHAQLGPIGGGHHDPGPAYPVEKVMAYARALSPDARKQSIWEAHLQTERARLKGLLALRARLRQRKLEQDARYTESTTAMNESKGRIRKLLSLLKRSK